MPPESDRQEMLIVTGMSGAGRSTVGNALEDLGWYVVDNLPPQMLRPFIELAERAGGALPRIAAVVDVRGGQAFSEVADELDALRGAIRLRVLFLEAADAVLVRRFEQVRRPHPLQGDGTTLDGIAVERARLAEVRSHADIVLDTTELNIHQLANRVAELFSEEGAAALRVTIESFGYKYGLPADADMVADCRFLPNPFWVSELKSLTGLDRAVREYVLGLPGAEQFLADYARSFEPVFAGFQRENKRHATIAIGCTGGRHRSVVMAEELADRLRQLPGVLVNVKHRDLGRE